MIDLLKVGLCYKKKKTRRQYNLGKFSWYFFQGDQRWKKAEKA
jgi:hypothetical protein